MEQVELVEFVIGVLEQQAIAYMFVGSIASGAYGEPRFTNDLDIVVALQTEQIEQFCAAFPEPEFYVSVAAAQDAVRLERPFNVIHPASGLKIDFMIARRDAWGRAQLARRRREQILPDREGYTASCEDVILGKLWYYREGGSEKHLRDIAGMLRVSGDTLDRAYLEKWIADLGFDSVWQALQDRIAAIEDVPSDNANGD